MNIGPILQPELFTFRFIFVKQLIIDIYTPYGFFREGWKDQANPKVEQVMKTMT